MLAGVVHQAADQFHHIPLTLRALDLRALDIDPSIDLLGHTNNGLNIFHVHVINIRIIIVDLSKADISEKKKRKSNTNIYSEKNYPLL